MKTPTWWLVLNIPLNIFLAYWLWNSFSILAGILLFNAGMCLEDLMNRLIEKSKKPQINKSKKIAGKKISPRRVD
jgi:hypothetical protein